MTAPRPLGGGLWTADVTPVARPMSGGAKDLVRRIRALPGTSVAGVTAWYLDTSSSLRRHLPAAGAILALTIVALLYLVTRSVILPLKAVVMNALSLSAAFGVLVWVFQDGRLEGVLRYSSQGALELTQPVLLFAIAFGLATDYGVFLLSRIREAHESGLAESRGGRARARADGPGRHRGGAALLRGGRVVRDLGDRDRQGGRARDRARGRDRRHARPGAARPEPDGAARRLELVAARPEAWLSWTAMELLLS